MRVPRKSVWWISIVCLALCTAIGVLTLRSRPHGKSVSGIMMQEPERGLRLVIQEDKNIWYWLDGEKSTPGCNWHLTHLDCKWDHCLYRCEETEALWMVRLRRDGLVMEKKSNTSTLPQCYVFHDETTR